MSTNWDKYATAEETQKQAIIPDDNGVLQLPVGGVRAIPHLEARHAPIAGNRAHTNVVGFDLAQNKMERNEMRVILARIAEWVIPLLPKNNSPK